MLQLIYGYNRSLPAVPRNTLPKKGISQPEQRRRTHAAQARRIKRKKLVSGTSFPIPQIHIYDCVATKAIAVPVDSFARVA